MLTQKILAAVAKQYKIENCIELQADKKGRNTIQMLKAKQMAAYLLYHINSYTHDQIKNILGYHSKQNVQSAIDKMQEIFDSNNDGDKGDAREILKNSFAKGTNWLTQILID